MTLQNSAYHSLLRIASLSLALVLLFESGVISHSTKQLSDNARYYVANAIGVQATVTPTELNQLTAELSAQKQDLREREAALRERELALGLNAGGETSESTTSTFILSSILFILLVLIIINYILDYLRSPKLQPAERMS